MTVKERLQSLRRLMKEQNIDAYMVPTDDFHNSEYVGDYFKCREFITGFTGSAGMAVILADEAGLWTDGRYFIQAAAQLEGSGVDLYKMGQPGVPNVNEFLLSHLGEGQTLGYDGRTMNALGGEALHKQLAAKGVKTEVDLDLVGEVWTDRPALSCKPAWVLEQKYCGKPRSEKIADLRKAMADKKADYHLLTSLDDIAWLLNIRGDDVDCNPVVLSYCVVTQSSLHLFAQAEAFSAEVQEELRKDGVTLDPYNDVYAYVKKIPEGKSVLLDKHSINYTLLRALPANVTIRQSMNPTTAAKAVKNGVEVANSRKAHIKDGVAVTRFVYWLKNTVGKETVTEMSAAAKLEEFRGEQEHYIGPSFEPIISYGTHAAIVHYSATEETDIPMQPEGTVLADTGAQFLEGTTDITRTIALGEVSQKEKEYFTRVLRGHLNLGNAKFLYGTTGKNLDYLAREPLWEIGEDFNHGTGHGVGFLLNVHEGPQSIRWRVRPGDVDTIFEAGMITSNEPGYYLENEFGIRIENLMVCVENEKTAAGQFLSFDQLTLVPIDLDCVVPEMLSAKERALLNQYHKTVYEKIAHLLPEAEREWLATATRAI